MKYDGSILNSLKLNYMYFGSCIYN